MKKFLLSMAAVASMAFAGYAHEASVTFSELGFENAAELTTVKVNDDITLTFAQGENSNTPKYYNSGSAARLYGGNSMTVTGASGVKFSAIEFKVGSSNPFNAESTASVGTRPQNASWTGDANAITFTQGGTKGHVRIASIKFTYTGGTGTGGSGTGGDTPTPPATEVTEVANIAAFLASASTTDTYKFTNSVNVVCQKDSYLFVQDATGGLLIFGNAGKTYKHGDVIPAGFEGKYQNYNGVLELTSPKNFQDASGTATITYETLANEEISADIVNQAVKVDGMTIRQDGNNYYGKDASGVELQLYNRMGMTIPTGENLTVYAVVGLYNKKPQLYPYEITDGSGQVVEVCKKPYINPASGEVKEGTQVTITCSTEGATIHYTTDGSEPTEASAVYSAPIVVNAAMTVKAIAVKAGMENSPVAIAEYTIRTAQPNVATFFFNEPATLTPAYAATFEAATAAGEPTYLPDGDNGNYYAAVSDVTFSVGTVTVTPAKGTSTDARMYYQSGGKIQLRSYKGSTLTIASTDANNPITEVKFGFNNGTTSSKQVTPALTDNTTWSDANGVASVTFNLAGTIQVNTIDVTCKGSLSGVEGVTGDETDAPVEYFNLQGVRVENPENGLYIRRQGSKVSKVVIR